MPNHPPVSLGSSSSSSSGAATDLSNLASPTAINDTTLTFAGAGGLQAGGTNQGITLYGSGSSASIQFQPSGGAGKTQLFITTGTTYSDNTSTTLRSSSGGVGAALDIKGHVYTELNAVTFSATPAFNLTNSNVQKITLTGDVSSSTTSGGHAGMIVVFIIVQDASGSHTFAWPANVFGGMTIAATASKTNVQPFIFDGTSLYALSAGQTGLG